MLLLEESIKLLWKVLKEGKANKEHINSQQYEFLRVASKAVRQTLSYIKDENKRDTKTEEELSELWANVALAARPFDSDLAERCYLKGNYWANPNSWSDEEIKNAGIEIGCIDTEIRNHFKGKARAKKSKQQKAIEKTEQGNEESKKKFSWKKIGTIVVSSILVLAAFTTLMLNLDKIKEMFRIETEKEIPSHRIVQQTMNESPRGTQIVGDVYIEKSESHIYRELSPNIKRELTLLLQEFRKRYNYLSIKISVTSEKGSKVRHRIAEEVADIFASAGFEAEATLPIIRFSNDTSDMVIKYNDNDTELVKEVYKVLSRFFRSTSFSASKNTNLQRGELQIIIAGDPLFSPDGIVTFQ